MMGLWVVLGVAAAIALVLGGLEVAVRITRKRNSRFEMMELKVVDTIGRNDDGTRRQDILVGMAGKKGEYKKLAYELRQYSRDEEEGFRVYVNGHQIGEIARDEVKTLLSVWNQIAEIFHINVFAVKGGKHYGATVTLKLKKQ